jgi:hypothetical protein
MQANNLFLNLSPDFWANVKLLSQHIGYTQRNNKGKDSLIKIPNLSEIKNAYKELSLDELALTSKKDDKILIDQLLKYFEYRANVLNDVISKNLMNKIEADSKFKELLQQFPIA